MSLLLHCMCIMKKSSNGLYEQEEELQQEKPTSVLLNTGAMIKVVSGDYQETLPRFIETN